jgi:hypothetical protein
MGSAGESLQSLQTGLRDRPRGDEPALSISLRAKVLDTGKRGHSSSGVCGTQVAKRMQRPIEAERP